MTYEKTQRELSERLERTTQETSNLGEIQKALEAERLRVDELQVNHVYPLCYALWFSLFHKEAGIFWASI